MSAVLVAGPGTGPIRRDSKGRFWQSGPGPWRHQAILRATERHSSPRRPRFRIARTARGPDRVPREGQARAPRSPGPAVAPVLRPARRRLNGGGAADRTRRPLASPRMARGWWRTGAAVVAVLAAVCASGPGGCRPTVFNRAPHGVRLHWGARCAEHQGDHEGCPGVTDGHQHAVEGRGFPTVRVSQSDFGYGICDGPRRTGILRHRAGRRGWVSRPRACHDHGPYDRVPLGGRALHGPPVPKPAAGPGQSAGGGTLPLYTGRRGGIWGRAVASWATTR